MADEDDLTSSVGRIVGWVQSIEKWKGSSIRLLILLLLFIVLIGLSFVDLSHLRNAAIVGEVQGWAWVACLVGWFVLVGVTWFESYRRQHDVTGTSPPQGERKLGSIATWALDLRRRYEGNYSEEGDRRYVGAVLAGKMVEMGKRKLTKQEAEEVIEQGFKNYGKRRRFFGIKAEKVLQDLVEKGYVGKHGDEYSFTGENLVEFFYAYMMMIRNRNHSYEHFTVVPGNAPIDRWVYIHAYAALVDDLSKVMPIIDYLLSVKAEEMKGLGGPEILRRIGLATQIAIEAGISGEQAEREILRKVMALANQMEEERQVD